MTEINFNRFLNGYNLLSPSLLSKPKLILNKPFSQFPGFGVNTYIQPLIPLDQIRLNVPQKGALANFSFFEEKNNYQTNLENEINKLKKISPAELKNLGKKADKTDFFKALLPAALETERIYGVPASVTLAQAALESDWGRAAIGGYNIFGIKGKGPTGESINKRTQEFDKQGNSKYINDNFAKYYNFHEAVVEHGKVFTRHPKFVKAVEQFKTDGNARLFLKNIASTYATAPNYEWAINKRIDHYQIDKIIAEFKTELSQK